MNSEQLSPFVRWTAAFLMMTALGCTAIRERCADGTPPRGPVNGVFECPASPDGGFSDTGSTPLPPEDTGNAGMNTEDLGEPIDVGFIPDVRPRDVGPPDTGVLVSTCGGQGQRCCHGRGCFNGGTCRDLLCLAPATREGNECMRPEDCGGGVCSGADFCDSMMRSCFHCRTPSGALGLRASCNNRMSCQSGLCVDGRCTIPCVLSPTSVGSCAVAGPNYFCAPSLYLTPLNAPTTLGECVQRCSRNGDCTANTVCRSHNDYLTGRINIFCALPRGTGGPGAICTDSSHCQSNICLVAGYCSAYCSSPADCRAGAPRCEVVMQTTVGGSTQDSQACVR